VDPFSTRLGHFARILVQLLKPSNLPNKKNEFFFQTCFYNPFLIGSIAADVASDLPATCHASCSWHRFKPHPSSGRFGKGTSAHVKKVNFRIESKLNQSRWNRK
jgi:hypothetical protein